MEPVTLMIQSGIGSIFTIYGICSLLSNRKNPNKGKNHTSNCLHFGGHLFIGICRFSNFIKGPLPKGSGSSIQTKRHRR